MFFDTHVHFKNRAEAELWIGQAAEAGVTRMLAVGGSPDANALALELSGTFPQSLQASVGFDRYLAEQPPDFSELAGQAALENCVAVGECGLDYFHEPETAPAQKKLFEMNMQLAAETGKPLIVHTRDADRDTVEMLTAYARGVWKGDADRIGVIHCFTREREQARAFLNLGFHISYSGIVTFLNADPLRETVDYVPDDRLLIETDSPYLAPVPQRGQKNCPAFVVHVAGRLAQLRGTAPEAIGKLTSENAVRLFGRK